MTLQAVFFDMGGTIETYSHDPELRLQATPDLQRLLLQAGIDLKLAIPELCQAIVDGLTRYRRWNAQWLQELSPETIWSDYILAGQPVDRRQLATIAEDLTLFLEDRFFQRRMRPEMPAVLETLQRMGLKMGVISNVMSQGLVPGNLRAYGIQEFFDPIVLSSTYGWRKPGPAIFHHAARLAGLPTSACAFVGDRISRDIAGAKRAGFRLTVQIQHDYDRDPEGQKPDPDAVIEDMSELVGVLEAEMRRPLPPRHPMRGENGIRAILFDAGDVLYHRPHKRKRFRAFLDGLGLSLPEDFDAQEDKLKAQAFRAEISQREYWKALVRLCGIDDADLVQQGLDLLRQDDDDIRFFEDIPETLTALKDRGLLLGIVTDTAHDTHTKLLWFEKGGFGHLWDAFVSSRDMQVRKPDPRIYDAALKQMGVAAHQVLFVGHKATELDGARALGIKTVAFNRDADAKADIEIDRFPQILDLVTGQSRSGGIEE